MSAPCISIVAPQQPARVISAVTAEHLWRCVCAVLASGLELSDAAVSDLSAHARELRDRIPAARLDQIDAERLARARG